MHRLHFVTQFVDHPTALNVATLMALVVIALAGCYLLSRLDLSVLVVVGLFLQLFSGNWSLMGIPLPLDRVVLAVALIVLVLKGARWVCARRLVLRPLHVAMLCAATWAVASGIIAGTLVGHLGFYSLLDRFGLVPFAMFTLAPLIFGTAKQRNNLLIGLVAIGPVPGGNGRLRGPPYLAVGLPQLHRQPELRHPVRQGERAHPGEHRGWLLHLVRDGGRRHRPHVVALSMGQVGLLPHHRIRRVRPFLHPY